MRVAGAEIRTYRWLPADGRRHAVPAGPVGPGNEITTLIGERVTVPTQRLGSTEWTWPTCEGCWDEAKKCTHVALAGLVVRPAAPAQVSMPATHQRKRQSS
ncbi:zinc finger protein [Kutzneria sp. CA-103260]|uniref:zinc finger protein n=1 Tax=Kutzneria sp. CA-103260 TaxID=2802641 RepID=UPI003FA5EAC3